MWIYVHDCRNNQAITYAWFTVSAYNNGNGWYYMYIGGGQSFCVGASGYATVCGNTDSYGSMWASLCPYTPPSTYGNCWSG
jgi:hypothetical protein